MTNSCNGYQSENALPAKLAQIMLRAVERKYDRLIRAARKEWERRFAGSDPSDACITIRINGVDSREFARFFPLEYSGRPEPFLTN
jgi:hypothetical protein